MNKRLAKILAAILLLCMLPATFISALAHGYGVANTATENQYWDSASGQYIPQLIAVDGNLSDSGWVTSDWVHTNDQNSTWDSTYPSDTNTEASYAYQLKLDNKHFYAAAVITLPAGVTTADLNLFLSEQKVNTNEANNRGCTGGFIFKIDTSKAGSSDMVTVTAQVGADEEAAEAQAANDGKYEYENWDGTVVITETITHNKGRSVLSIAGNPDEYGPYGESGTIPENEAYQLAAKYENGVVIIEFRNRIWDTYDPDMYTDYSTEENPVKCGLSYYFGLGLANANSMSGSGYDWLYSPLYSRNNVNALNAAPTAENWPGGGSVVDVDNNEFAMTSLITPDGKFDEAIWAGYTDFYQEHSDNVYDHVTAEDMALLSFDNVKYVENTYDPFTYTDGKKLVNIAQGKKYTTVGSIGSAYPDTNKVELTDGKTLEDVTEYSNDTQTGWVGFHTDNAESQVIIDLAGMYSIRSVDIYALARHAVGIYENDFEVYYTVNGIDWILFGYHTRSTANDSNTSYKAQITTSCAAPANHDIYATKIKVVFSHTWRPDEPTRRAWNFVSEITVDGYKCGTALRNIISGNTNYSFSKQTSNEIGYRDKKADGTTSDRWSGSELTDGYIINDTNLKDDSVDSNGASITSNATYQSSHWVGWNDAKANPIVITIPLGDGNTLYDVYEVITSVGTDKMDAGIYEPSIEVTYSKDGTTYQSFGTYTTKNTTTSYTLDISVKKAAPVQAKYIKVKISSASLVFISEIQIQGVESAHQKEPDYIAKYDIRTDSNYLYGAIYQYSPRDNDDGTPFFPGIYLYANGNTNANNDLALGLGEDMLKTTTNVEFRKTEFRIPLSYFDPDKDGNFTYAIKLGNTLSDWISVTAEDCVGNAADSLVIDGDFADGHWVALRAADNKFDGLGRTGVNYTEYTDVEHLAYDLKTDGTYIYGAAVVVLPNGWTTVTSNEALTRNGDQIRFVISPDLNPFHYYGIDFYTVQGEPKCMAFYDSTNKTKVANPASIEYTLTVEEYGENGNIAVLEFTVDIAKFNAMAKTSFGSTQLLVVESGTGNDPFFSYVLNFHKGTTTDNGVISSLVHSYNLASYDDLISIRGYGVIEFSNVVHYSDFVTQIEVDGYIDESVWLDNMTHVDMTNGSYYNREPFDGFGLSYDYQVYTVGNYMYGAVITDFVGDDTNKLAFNVWFDNYVDERELMQERLSDSLAKYSQVPVEYQVEQRSYTVQTYTAPGTFSEDGKTVLTGPTEGSKQTIYKDELIYYVNHQYSFKLFGEQYDNERLRNNDFPYDVNPEAAPDYFAYYDGTLDKNGRIKTDHIVKENGVHYEYQYKVVDGKTYLEFKVDLTSVRCHDTDFRFYVSLYYDFPLKNVKYELAYPKVGDTNEDGTLTIVEPVWIFSKDNQLNDNNCEVSYGNGSYFPLRSASGRLMTYSSWKNGNQAGYGYHTLAILGAEDFANNKYKVLAIVEDTTELSVKYAKDHPDVTDYGIRLVTAAAEKATGGTANAYIYAVDSGSYVAKNNHATVNSRYYIATEDVDQTNFRAYDALAEVALGWEEGDIVEFDFGTDANGNKITQATLELSNRYYIQYYGRINGTTPSDYTVENSVNIVGLTKTIGTIISKISTTAYVNDKTTTTSQGIEHTGESRAIYCPYTVKRTLSVDHMGVSYERHNTFMPEFDKYGYRNVWMYGTGYYVQTVQHIAPETVDVDGNLGDTAWTESGWTHVDPDINGMTSDGEGTSFKYQFRTDGDYLYVAAVIDAAFAEGTYFRLWLNSEGSISFSKYYELGYGGTSLDISVPDPTGETVADSTFAEGATGSAYENGKLTYSNNMALTVADNNAKNDPNDVRDITVLGYGNSDLYGYTDEIWESTSDGVWVWEAHPQTQGFRFGNDHGVIGSDANLNVINARGTGMNTIVEFKVSLAEFGGASGFEYFVQAGSASGTTLYPRHQREAYSDTNYEELYHPSWKWDSAKAEKIALLDLVPSSKLWLTNDYAPVTSIGSKIKENYDGSGNGAIRFGARYTESFIREIAGAEDATYWDVENMGIVFLPYHYVCAGQPLDIENENAKVVTALDIVDWKHDAIDAKTNFADYESFVFYVNLVGIPPAAYSMEFMYCGFVDYYGKVTGYDTYYGIPLARSYAGVLNNGYSANEGEVLPPHSDY